MSLLLRQTATNQQMETRENKLADATFKTTDSNKGAFLKMCRWKMQINDMHLLAYFFSIQILKGLFYFKKEQHFLHLQNE